MIELVSFLLVILVLIIIWGIPFLLGGWILLRKKPCGFLLFFIALFLSFFYFSGTSVLRMIHNDDMPGSIHINEAFMFDVEKNFGLKNWYDWCQKRIAESNQGEDISGRLPSVPFKYHFIVPDQDSMRILFFITRGNDGALSAEVKVPEQTFQRFNGYDEERFYKSIWNRDFCVAIDRNTWGWRIDDSLPFYKKTVAFFMVLMFSLTWIFPLAAVACKMRRRWFFVVMWCVVGVLFLMNLFNWSQQTPALQFERCDPRDAIAVLAQSANQAALTKLLSHPTALLIDDKSKTIIDAPLLCSGDFFSARFLCWDLGKENYLYYSPTDLLKSQLFAGNAQIHQPGDNFYLVSYPKFVRVSNNKWWEFAAVQTLAGLLWLVMFALGLKKRRESAGEGM